MPVTGQLLILIESNKKPIAAPPGSTLTDIRHLDSAYTDEEGNYEITFITTGRGDTYHILPARSDSVWTFHGQEEIKPLGTSKEINFQYLHLYPATLRIRLNNDVEHLPIRIGHNRTLGLEAIQETGKEVVRHLYIDKNHPQEIRFWRTTQTGYQSASFTLPATHSTEPTEFELTVSNSDFKDL